MFKPRIFFFCVKRTTNVVKSCLHVILSHLQVSSVYFETNFQKDCSSYVLFLGYIYSDKSGRLALN